MGDIVNNFTREFLLKNINLDLSDELKEIERYCFKQGIPLIDKEIQNLINMLFLIKPPKRILEFGTAVGFSSIFMYEQLKGNVFITTMERDLNRICIAKKNFEKFNCLSKIEIIEGDCLENVKRLHCKYDFIFVDSSKAHYGKLFYSCIQNLSKDGIILFDNVLYKGMVISDELIKKRSKTIVKNMRCFIQDLTKDRNFSTLLLPIGDGIMILRRK